MNIEMLVMLQPARICRAAIVVHKYASASSLSQTFNIAAQVIESPNAANLHISLRTAMNSRNKALINCSSLTIMQLISSTLHPSQIHKIQLIP